MPKLLTCDLGCCISQARSSSCDGPGLAFRALGEGLGREGFLTGTAKGQLLNGGLGWGIVVDGFGLVLNAFECIFASRSETGPQSDLLFALAGKSLSLALSNTQRMWLQRGS